MGKKSALHDFTCFHRSCCPSRSQSQNPQSFIKFWYIHTAILLPCPVKSSIGHIKLALSFQSSLQRIHVSWAEQEKKIKKKKRKIFLFQEIWVIFASSPELMGILHFRCPLVNLLFPCFCAWTAATCSPFAGCLHAHDGHVAYLLLRPCLACLYPKPSVCVHVHLQILMRNEVGRFVLSSVSTITA